MKTHKPNTNEEVSLCVCVFFFEGGGDPEKSQLETRERIADGEPLDEEFEE